jgi:polysaccharide export outer membrane protein
MNQNSGDRRPTTGRAVRTAAAAALLLCGCKAVGPFVWVQDYRDPSPRPAQGYVIARGDVIKVSVWNQEGMSGRTRVRADGMISLPFVNDVEAAGFEPAALAKRVQARLKDYIVNPMVTVSLEEPAPFEVSVLGEVAKPGVYRSDSDASLLKVLAMAGGLNELAGRDLIFVIRRDDGVPVRIRFTYEALARAEKAPASFRLRPGDVVVVE